MGKGKKRGVRKAMGRYITCESEMRARDLSELKQRNPEATLDAGDNSDVDLMSSDDDATAEISESLKNVPVFVPDAPLNAATLLETANPNAKKAQNIKVQDLKQMGEQQLSRKEREFIEAQRAQRELERKTALGQTEESKADLNRLAEIRKERERAKERRAAELKKKEELRAQASQRAEEMKLKVQKKNTSKKSKKKK